MTGGHINELKGHVEGIRIVPNDMNILVDKGSHVTGVIDWEYQTLQPAVVAADYPQWLSYDARCDPHFADPKQKFRLESPMESKCLRDVYLQVGILSMAIRYFLIQ
jgi:hypothetical protein